MIVSILSFPRVLLIYQFISFNRQQNHASLTGEITRTEREQTHSSYHCYAMLGPCRTFSCRAVSCKCKISSKWCHFYDLELVTLPSPPFWHMQNTVCSVITISDWVYHRSALNSRYWLHNSEFWLLLLSSYIFCKRSDEERMWSKRQ